MKKTIERSDMKIDAFLVVYIPVLAIISLKIIARNNKQLLLHDSVEWYSTNQFKLGKFSPDYIKKTLYNRLLINKEFKVIAISKYLEEHFKYRGIKTERIPVIFPIKENITRDKIDNSKLYLFYAGSPGKKDHLKTMLVGLSLFETTQLRKINFDIYGVTNKDIKEQLDPITYNKIKGSIVAHGRVKRNIILEKLTKSHFSVLLRDSNMRYAQAGFPTKIVESLMMGTPVITNLTSDLEIYLTDGVDSLIVKDCSADEFHNTILRAFKVIGTGNVEMSESAYKTAKLNFDIKIYKEKINKLLEL